MAATDGKPADRLRRHGPQAGLIALLLRRAAREAPAGSEPGRVAPAQPALVAGERELRWALAGGIGPLVQRAADQGAVALPPAWRDAVLAADLAALVRQAMLTDAALEVIDTCARLQVPVTLLKGISVAGQFYAEEHLRPMTDIDVLVPPAGFVAVQGALVEQGYAELPLPEGEVFHHGPPLHHPRTGATLEVHTGLFAPRSPFSQGTLFGARRAAAEIVPSAYRGRSVGRLSSELQLPYIAASWFNDLTNCGLHPTFLPSLLDAVQLLAANGPSLRWDGILGWLDNEFARAALRVLLGYVPRFGVAPAPPFVSRELRADSLVGPLELPLIHAALDHCLVGGRPWRLPLPPPVPGRYDLGVQFNKKVLGRLPGASLRALPRQGA